GRLLAAGDSGFSSPWRRTCGARETLSSTGHKIEASAPTFHAINIRYHSSAQLRGGTMLKTNKKLSARRQTIAAIEHLHKKDYECAITLAGAREGRGKEGGSHNF